MSNFDMMKALTLCEGYAVGGRAVEAYLLLEKSVCVCVCVGGGLEIVSVFQSGEERLGWGGGGGGEGRE